MKQCILCFFLIIILFACSKNDSKKAEGNGAVQTQAASVFIVGELFYAEHIDSLNPAKNQPAYMMDITIANTAFSQQNKFLTSSLSWEFKTKSDLGSLTGRIIDEDGNPISGVKISVEGANVDSVKTDDNGYYTIDGIREGSYEVNISKSGYKSKEEISAIKESNQIVAKVLSDLGKMIKPGVQTRELDEHAERTAKEMGAVPAFKGYRGFPASLCTSINEEIVHGIPSARTLREGDIISLDFGVVYEGYYGDAAVTHPVGKVSSAADKLIAAARDSFFEGIKQLKVGKRLSDVSCAIQKHVESQGFSVIRAFVGHGIGMSLHEEPQIPNFGLPGHGPKIKPGMVLAIEPMIAVGDWNVEILDDKWTAITRDKSLSAHYEHSVAVTENGVEILSLMETEADSSYAKESQYA